MCCWNQWFRSVNCKAWVKSSSFSPQKTSQQWQGLLESGILSVPSSSWRAALVLRAAEPGHTTQGCSESSGLHFLRLQTWGDAFLWLMSSNMDRSTARGPSLGVWHEKCPEILLGVSWPLSEASRDAGNSQFHWDWKIELLSRDLVCLYSFIRDSVCLLHGWQSF